MIQDILWNVTTYNLADSKSIVIRWINIRLDELIQEEISFGIEVECNNFKIFIEIFFGQIKAIKEQVNEFVKLAKQKVAKIYKAAYMKNVLVFEIDDEPIPKVDTPAFPDIRSGIWGASIALNGTKSQKKKRLASISLSKEKSNMETAIRLADSFEKTASKLANGFLASKSTAQPVTTLLTAFTNSISTTSNNSLVLAQWVTDLEAKCRSMQDMIDQIFQVVKGLSSSITSVDTQ